MSGCVRVARIALGYPSGMAEEWPSILWLLRHGQSAGNVARDAAEAGGLPRIDIAQRDMDVPLSALGERQAAAVARWFASRPADERPTRTSARRTPGPSRRRASSARRAGGAGDLDVDERLREREFGVLDRLTRAGITELLPEQAEFRRFLGKFYHRPPGGESWCDVGLRLRTLLDELRCDYAGRPAARGHARGRDQDDALRAGAARRAVGHGDRPRLGARELLADDLRPRPDGEPPPPVPAGRVQRRRGRSATRARA